ncbi:IDEAL domain-containing protein [Lentibacillus sp. L22]|uniref:IDEAL domain-containing protein n=1 Tax=Lentibacillus TaxID=175304 RepID=UPI0022B19222|nr:IDEAL domain-containing protein [Lentibacillus daqui]
MKKQKLVYKYFRYTGDMIHAKREIPYELRLASRMLLDELCFNWNKAHLEAAINQAIDNGDEVEFLRLSEKYKQFVWE